MSLSYLPDIEMAENISSFTNSRVVGIIKQLRQSKSLQGARMYEC